MSVLVAYGTIEGQTGKIARYVQKLIEDAGHQTILFDTSNQIDDVDFDGVDRVILAASVHERRHPKSFEVFVSGHQNQLEKRRLLLLSVSLSAAFPEGQQEAQSYVDEMKMRTGLESEADVLVAGAVKTKRYDYYATQVVRHVVLRDREFDPTLEEHEFTDWEVLAEKVLAFV